MGYRGRGEGVMFNSLSYHKHVTCYASHVYYFPHCGVGLPTVPLPCGKLCPRLALAHLWPNAQQAKAFVVQVNASVVTGASLEPCTQRERARVEECREVRGR